MNWRWNIESQRIAILLRGQQCSGKTATARVLLGGKEPISLDDGKYDQLRSKEAVLVLELGYGERPGAQPGPTRDPRQWQNVLAEQKRELFAFKLTVDEDVAKKRAKSEDAHKRHVSEDTLRASEVLYRNCPEVVNFAGKAGITEHVINTSHKTVEQVAADIRARIAESRPSQQWPSTQS